MKALGQFLGIGASIFTIVATILRLKWARVRAQPGPTPPESDSQRFWRRIFGVWLVLIGIAVLLFIIAMVVIPVARMSN